MLSIRKGFTLVEILIVLALIGLFIAATSYLTHDSRIAQKNAERLADNINTTFRNARTNMVLGRGVSSGSTLATTDKRVISIGSTGIKTTYGTTNTGTESNLPYPFYDGDTNYKITDISVSSGILINGQMPIWDHTGVTAADIIILKDGTIDITAALVATKINAIRITAGYEGFEQSVMIDRIMGRSEVVQGKGESTFIIPPPAPVYGDCDNSTFLSCDAGTASGGIPGSCGGSATWYCLGDNGGTDDLTCNKSNPACALPPATCGGSALSCSTAAFVAGSDNGVTCGPNRTWNCGGAGYSTVACSSANPACALPPATCGGSALSCSTAAFVAGSDNGVTCGPNRTWNCGGAGYSTVACSSANPACALPPATCGGSALSCSTAAFVAGSDNGVTCGPNRTWNCGGAGYSTVACSSANPACALPPATCGGSALSCSTAAFVAGSDNGVTCGPNRTWNCGGAGYSTVACSSANPACALPPATCGGSALSCSTAAFVAGSDNGVTCGPNRTWNCGGAGYSTVACSSANPACIVPVDCVGSWSSYGSCSATCGAGNTKTRTFSRTTAAANGGLTCTAIYGAENGGTESSSAGCNTAACCVENAGTPVACSAVAGSYGIPVNYTVGLASWTQNSCTSIITYQGGCSAYVPTSGPYSYGGWGGCAGACGPNNASQSRSETCSYDSCYSPQATTQACTASACPTSGPYSYGGWGACDQACGPGNQYRSETCSYDSCYSPQTTTQSCNNGACAAPVNAVCGTAFSCAAGVLDPNQNEATPKESYPRGCYYDWHCDGINGGSSAACFDAVGCFAAEELVKTPYGETKISELRVGYKVISYDESKNTFVENTIDKIIVHDGIQNSRHDFSQFPLLDVIITTNGVEKRTKVTANHLYYSPDKKEYQYISEFNIGDQVRSIDGIGYIVSKNPISLAPTVYNLHMQHQPNNYLVNGIVVHNEKAESCNGCAGPGCNSSSAWY